MLAKSGLNESHQRRLRANAQYADKLLSDIEGILTASESKSPFPKYIPDISLQQARLVRAHIARFRDHLSHVLPAIGVPAESARFGSLHSIRVTLTFVRVAIEEMDPEHLRGYGALSSSAAAELRGLCNELEGLIDGLERNLALGDAVDLQARLSRLDQTPREADLLRLLDLIITEDEMAEFRAPLLSLVERLESPRFEIAVFGRVSSGKSSLLNHVVGTGVLPVGVNPITAVPTRIVYGQEPSLMVTFVDRQVKRGPAGDLAEYASEERNPGNERGVTRLVVALPSERLHDGLELVDTPGLGALATAGAAETLSYLPQCDLGIILISAVNPINEEDLNTIHALSQAAIPVMVLLSKADLLSPADLEKTAGYSRNKILENLGLHVGVHPVSTVGQSEAMLEDWFTQEMAPLFERHRELAEQSIRRKSGALRESVVSALRAKLGDGGSGASPVPVPLEQIEHRLRAAAGAIEEARRVCTDAADGVRSLDETALRSGVEAILEQRAGGRKDPASMSLAIRVAADRVAAEASSSVAARLTGLAQTLQSALVAAGDALHESNSTPDAKFEDSVRGLPRFEVAFPEIDIAPPWFLRARFLARPWTANRLRQTAGPSLQSAFVNYGRALGLWVRSTLAGLQHLFEERADMYRAQLARLTSRKDLSGEERVRLERHLEALDRWMTAGVPN